MPSQYHHCGCKTLVHRVCIRQREEIVADRSPLMPNMSNMSSLHSRPAAPNGTRSPTITTAIGWRPIPVAWTNNLRLAVATY